jgi:hypothetical protein
MIQSHENSSSLEMEDAARDAPCARADAGTSDGAKTIATAERSVRFFRAGPRRLRRAAASRNSGGGIPDESLPCRCMASELHAAFRLFAAAVVLSSTALTACSGTDGGEEPFPTFNGDCTTVKAVPTFAELQRGILPICLGCHSSQVIGPARHNAPEGLNFDTYEVFSAVADTAVPLVRERRMPPPNGDGPTESQRNQLYAWAACGKPR